MTYEQLYNSILELDDEQLSMDVSIYDKKIDEYFKIDDFVILNDDNGVLDDNHPVFVLE